MDIQKQYELLAAQLGDVVYKLELLEQHKTSLMQQIKKLDALAGRLANEAEEKNAEERAAGTDSPA